MLLFVSNPGVSVYKLTPALKGEEGVFKLAGPGCMIGSKFTKVLIGPRCVIEVTPGSTAAPVVKAGELVAKLASLIGFVRVLIYL